MLIRYPHRVTVNNKRLVSKRKKSERKYAYTLPPTSNWSLFKLNFSDPEQMKLK